jgi:hypothetical protein
MAQSVNVNTHLSIITINDLKDKYFSGDALNDQELQALKNYDRYRIAYLNSAQSEEEFSKRYIDLQAKANLSPYTEFLLPPYSNHLINQ